MLSFTQLFTEAVDQKAALARLHGIAKDTTFSYGNSIDVDYIFKRPMAELPAHEWSDVIVHRDRVGGIRMHNVPVNLLIPTQPGVSVSGIERFIKTNPNRWNDDKEDVLSIFFKAGKLYVGGGHHRVAAAILMGYATVPAEITAL